MKPCPLSMAVLLGWDLWPHTWRRGDEQHFAFIAVWVLTVQRDRSLQLLPLWPSCHDGLQPRIVGQNSPFHCFCCNIFIHQQEKKPRLRGTLIFKTRKLGGHYPKGQLNTWLPEFKAILMCRSLSVSHAVNQGSHESHGCLWSWFSAT